MSLLRPRLLWRTHTFEPKSHAYTKVAVNGGTAWVGVGGRVVAVDLDEGEVRFAEAVAGEQDSVVPVAFVDGDAVFLTGVVQVLLAAAMAFYPFASLMSLTILIAAFMLVDGIFRIVLAYQTREVPGWGWTLAGGIAGVVASVIVMTALPASSFWVIGILVGVNLIGVGAARIAIAVAARKVAKATE